jgi:hypothetical protein
LLTAGFADAHIESNHLRRTVGYPDQPMRASIILLMTIP